MTKIEGLDSLVNLEELYLSHNGLTRIEGLRNLVRPRRARLLCVLGLLTHPLWRPFLQKKLSTLDVGNNKITEAAAEELAPLTELEEFWVRTTTISHVRVSILP